MFTEDYNAAGEELLSYFVASGDMRNIPINERNICLRSHPKFGLILMGEVPDCGQECDADFSQVLLEYTMSCEDCRNKGMTTQFVDRFGKRLGYPLIEKLIGRSEGKNQVAELARMMELILNSMGVEFDKDLSTDRLRFSLDHCPIHQAARSKGLNVWIPLAHRAFVSLTDYLIQDLAEDWVLEIPAETETDAPLQEILITRSVAP